MPRSDAIINVPGFTIQKIETGDPIIYHVRYRKKPRCVGCGGRNLRLKDRFQRDILHETVGIRRTVLRVSARKFHCRDCKRYFNERFEAVLPRFRATERLKRQIFHQHSEGISQATLAGWYKLGKATVERWYHQHYQRLHRERDHKRVPRVLGIDEHFFSKKQGFATTFCDLAKQKIFDVVKGKNARDLEAFLLSLEGRDKVRVVCIDLSSNYRSLIRKYFPNAKIVADRFHVIRLINHHFIKGCRQLDPSLSTKRGIIRLLRMRPDRLNNQQKKRLELYFEQQPSVGYVYDFIVQLCALMNQKHHTQQSCKRLIPEFLQRIAMLKQSGLEAMRKLGKTLQKWQEEMARMWRFTKSNGITEGFHRKMKLIQRRAYGFKNFENYRVRVKVLCG